MKDKLDKEMNDYWIKGGVKDHAVKDLDRDLEEYIK